MLQSVQYLEMRERKLFELLEKKDKEIQEHELLGSQISRRKIYITMYKYTDLKFHL